MALRKNELGLIVRAKSYGKTSYNDLARQLGLKNGETLYAVSQEKGVRVSRPIAPGSASVDQKPGTSFVAGPTITKAAFGFLRSRQTDDESLPKEMATAVSGKAPESLMREVRALRASGFGGAPDPLRTEWGWSIRMKGLILPGGSRTDALILLPDAYPLASPIGFYLRAGSNVGGLDLEHLFPRSYHGAPDLSGSGWLWFCGVAENWIPGRHDLTGFVSAVYALLSERMPA